MILGLEEATTPVKVLESAAREVLSLGTLIKCLLQPSARNNPEIASLRSSVRQLKEVFERWKKDGCSCSVLLMTAKQELMELTEWLIGLATKLIPNMTSCQHVRQNAAKIQDALASVAKPARDSQRA